MLFQKESCSFIAQTLRDLFTLNNWFSESHTVRMYVVRTVLCNTACAVLSLYLHFKGTDLVGIVSRTLYIIC